MTDIPCVAFSWIGQSFKFCDDCGHPFWDHTHTYKLGSGTPFGVERPLVPITPEDAAACKAKWGRVR